MMGEPEIWAPKIRAIVDSSLSRRPDGKTHFARVKAYIGDGSYRVKSAGGQGSHQLSAMADANALAVIPDGDGINEGELVEIIFLHQLTASQWLLGSNLFIVREELTDTLGGYIKICVSLSRIDVIFDAHTACRLKA